MATKDKNPDRLSTGGRGVKAEGQDAIELLESQHREVESLFETFEKAKDGSAKRRAFQQIADMLAIHSTIEEHHFYPAVKKKQTDDLLREALEEHLSAKRLIADLLQMSVTDKAYEAKVKVLKEQVEHHVEEEEGELFPKVRELLASEDLVEVAQAMQKEASSLEGHKPRDRVANETDRAAPL